MVNLFVYLSLYGCASNSTTSVQYPNSTKIGIAYTISGSATHIDPGFTVFNRIEETHPVDWKIGAGMSTELISTLNFESVQFEAPAWLVESWDDIFYPTPRFSVRPGEPLLNKNYTEKLGALCAETGSDAMILLGTFYSDRIMHYKTTLDASGYGLWTQPGLGNGPAFSYANLVAVAVNCSPVFISASVVAHPNNREKLVSFVQPKKYKDMPMSEISKTKSYVERMSKLVASKMAEILNQGKEKSFEMVKLKREKT